MLRNLLSIVLLLIWSVKIHLSVDQVYKILLSRKDSSLSCICLTEHYWFSSNWQKCSSSCHLVSAITRRFFALLHIMLSSTRSIMSSILRQLASKKILSQIFLALSINGSIQKGTQHVRKKMYNLLHLFCVWHILRIK